MLDLNITDAFDLNFEGDESQSNISAKHRAKKRKPKRGLIKVKHAGIGSTKKEEVKKGTPLSNKQQEEAIDELATQNIQAAEDLLVPQGEAPSAASQSEVAQSETITAEDVVQSESPVEEYIPVEEEILSEEVTEDFLGIKESVDGKIMGLSKPIFYAFVSGVALGLAYLAFKTLKNN